MTTKTSKTTAPAGSGIAIRNLTDQTLPIAQIIETVVIDSRPISREFLLAPFEVREITLAQFEELEAWTKLNGKPGWQVNGFARIEAGAESGLLVVTP